MGPVFEISLATFDDDALDLIHATLLQVANEVVATRDGRVWDVWSSDQPFHTEVDLNASTIVISAGCNGDEDHASPERIANALLRRLSMYIERCRE